MVEHRYYTVTDTIELRKKEDGTEVLFGYAVKYNSLSRMIGWGFREKFEPGAFDAVLAADPANLDNDIVALFQHNPMWVLGRRSSGTLKLGSDETGLWYEAELPNTQAGNDLRELVRRGDVRHSSFGFIVAPEGQRWERPEKKADEIRVITNVSWLADVSPVTDPAYADTEVSLSEARSIRDAQLGADDTDWQAEARARQIHLISINP